MAGHLRFAAVVCMSRRICVALFDALIKVRPEWDAETLKVVMTSSAEDGPDWQRHIGNKTQRRELANRFKDAKDPFKIVIVREDESPRRLWLTGFDAPCLHTMYAEKPMQGHGLSRLFSRQGFEAKLVRGQEFAVARAAEPDVGDFRSLHL